MKALKTIILAGAAAAGCAASQQGAVSGAFVEESAALAESGNTYWHFVALNSGNETVLKAMVTDTEDSDKLEWTARGNFRAGSFKGTADIIGMENSEDDSGIGLNARASSGGTTIGAALEKTVVSGAPSELSKAYLIQEVKLGDGKVLALTGGYCDSSGQGKGIFAVSLVDAPYLIGAGALPDFEGGNTMTAVLGRFTTKGNGIGFRLWGKTDFEGNNLVDLILSSKSNFSRVSVNGPVSPDSGMIDQKLMDNRFDSHTYLWERGNGIVLHACHSESDSGMIDLLESVYHFRREGRIFVPRAFAGYKNSAGTESGSIGIGGMGSRGYFDLGVNFGEGAKPGISATVGASLNF